MYNILFGFYLKVHSSEITWIQSWYFNRSWYRLESYYVNRKDHPLNEAENVIFDANNDVVKIGKIMADKDEVHGEFIGMMKLSPRGAEIFKSHFNRSKELYWNKPFQRAKVFQKAYITDLLQEMADLVFLYIVW